MVTCLVLVQRGAEALAATLSALVPAVVEGLLADAVVIRRRPEAAVAKVADALGASIVEPAAGANPWAAAAAVARQPWVLLLEDGDAPVEGWIGAVERFLALADATSGAALLPRSGGIAGSVRTEARLLLGVRRPCAGLLLRKRLLTPAGLQARVWPVRLRARIARAIA
jgi:hypothetical protein